MPRILITGSRHWDNHGAIRRALADLPGDATIVHGGCPTGADAYADKIARMFGLAVEVHPADWGTHGRAAGPIRNQHMVDLGADLCLAFPDTYSRGTWDCVRRARAAGIPTRVYGEEEPNA